jgi:protein gp37
MDNTKIEWTNSTWNPVRGCSIVSKGCTNCYAMKQAHRSSGPGRAYAGLTVMSNAGPVWNGKIKLVPQLLDQPLRWKKPRLIFVNSMSDLFHEDIPDAFIDQVFAVMALCPQHKFQILTKRPERMKAWFEERWQGTPAQRIEFEGLPPLDIPAGGETGRAGQVEEACEEFLQAFGLVDTDKKHLWTEEGSCKAMQWEWPLPNVWLGVSVEDQKSADARIPLLLETPAAVRWISAEPLLDKVEISPFHFPRWDCDECGRDGRWADKACECDPRQRREYPGLDWVVVGGESGHRARPMHPDWARSLRDQCNAAGVPFFFKQFGEWAIDGARPAGPSAIPGNMCRVITLGMPDYYAAVSMDGSTMTKLVCVGKKAAGRLLDGRTWDEYPQ